MPQSGMSKTSASIVVVWKKIEGSSAESMTDDFWIHVGFGTGVAGTVTAGAASSVLAAIVGEGVAKETVADGVAVPGACGVTVGVPAGT
jgi:hypothetical protein